MKQALVVIILASLMTNCTVIGFVHDVTRPNREQKMLDSIHEPNQDLSLIKKNGERLNGTFQSFSYEENRIEQNIENSVPFLSLGDSLKVEQSDGTTYNGLFRGFRRNSGQKVMLVQPYWNSVRRYKLDLNNITSISDINRKTVFNSPNENYIHVRLQAGESEHRIPLSEVNHLNFITIKPTPYGTAAGLIIDSLIIYIAIKSCCNFSMGNMGI